MMPVFSIVIPVYNAEKYLFETLEAVINQNFSDFEVLLVDDGSTDSSAEICRSFEKRDARFTLYQKPNGGVSSARNSGIDHAKGEYIIFIDSDDTIVTSLLADAFQNLSATKADILLFGMQFDIERQGKIVRTYQKKHKSCLFDSTELGNYYRSLYENNYITSMCNRVTRLALIKEHSLRFDEKITNYEDMIFSLACLRCAQKVSVCDKSYYHYKLREELGMSRKYKDHLTETLQPTVDLLLKNIRSLPLDKETERWACCDVQRILWIGVANICRKKCSVFSKRDEIRNLCTEPWVEDLLPLRATGNKYNDVCTSLCKKKLWLAETLWNIFANHLRDMRH